MMIIAEIVVQYDVTSRDRIVRYIMKLEENVCKNFRYLNVNKGRNDAYDLLIRTGAIFFFIMYLA